MTSDDWAEFAHSLTNHLVDAGHITDFAWRRAFAETPRHSFVSTIRVDGRWIREDEPDWLAAAYRDEPLTIKVAPFAHGANETTNSGANDTTNLGGVPVASSSLPSGMAVMLDRLRLGSNDRVLEIGTGTGYNAALISHRVGADCVVSIDLDPELVMVARHRLNELGYRPELRIGNGIAGVADRAPYDAIVATCSVTHIPPAWIDQLSPGGRLVVPLGMAGGGLAVLTKSDINEVTGRFDKYTISFMPLRPEVGDARGPLDHTDSESGGSFIAHEGAVSTGGSNRAGQEVGEDFCWGSVAKDTPRSVVEFAGHGVEVGLVVGDVGGRSQPVEAIELVRRSVKTSAGVR